MQGRLAPVIDFFCFESYGVFAHSFTKKGLAMSLSRILGQWFQSKVRRPIRNRTTPRNKLRLAAESLEDRITPVVGVLGPATFYNNDSLAYAIPSSPAWPDTSIVALHGTFTDDTPSDHPTLDIDWADGTQMLGIPLSFSGGIGSYTVDHPYDSVGSFTATVTLRDGNGNFLNSVTKNITTRTVALTGTTTAAQNAVEGQNDPITVGTFTTSSPNPDLSDYGGSITWGDGQPNTTVAAGNFQLVSYNFDGSGNPTGSTWQIVANHTYAEEGTDFASTTVTADSVTLSPALGATTVNIADAPLTNTSSTVSANSTEGASTGSIVVATFTDANPGDNTADFTSGGGSVTIHWGDGQSSPGSVSYQGGTYTVTGSHTYLQESATPYGVTVDVQDDGGSSLIGIGQTTVTVADAPPTVTENASNIAGVVGANLTNSGTFSDYDDNVTITASTDGVQDSLPDSTISQGTGISGNWTWSDSSLSTGPHSITITATNADGSVNSTSFNVFVSNAVWVDDNWADSANDPPQNGDIVTPQSDETAPDSGGLTLIYGENAFSTIQTGVNAAATGGDVYVLPGTYTETVTIGESLSLLGPNMGISPNDTPSQRVAEAVIDGSVSITAGDVDMDGFTVDPAGAAIIASGASSVSILNNIVTASGGCGCVDVSNTPDVTIADDNLDQTGGTLNPGDDIAVDGATSVYLSNVSATCNIGSQASENGNNISISDTAASVSFFDVFTQCNIGSQASENGNDVAINGAGSVSITGGSFSNTDGNGGLDLQNVSGDTTLSGVTADDLSAEACSDITLQASIGSTGVATNSTIANGISLSSVGDVSITDADVTNTTDGQAAISINGASSVVLSGDTAHNMAVSGQDGININNVSNTVSLSNVYVCCLSSGGQDGVSLTNIPNSGTATPSITLDSVSVEDAAVGIYIGSGTASITDPAITVPAASGGTESIGVETDVDCGGAEISGGSISLDSDATSNTGTIGVLSFARGGGMSSTMIEGMQTAINVGGADVEGPFSISNVVISGGAGGAGGAGGGNGGFGIVVESGASVTISAVTIDDPTYGIDINGGSASIDGSTITNNDVGIFVENNGSATIGATTGNYIYANTTGIEFTTGGSGSVSNNDFRGSTDNATDLLLDSSSSTPISGGAVTTNDFAGTTYIENLSPQNITALSSSNMYYESDNSTVQTDNFQIRDHMYDEIDNAASGLVIWVTNHIYVTPTASPTATDNDYTRLANAVAAAESGNEIDLQGTFDWTEANANASWALGNGGGNPNDFYALEIPAGLNDVTLTAPGGLGTAAIQGPGDITAETGGYTGEFLQFYTPTQSTTNQDWTISNLDINDFNIAIAMFNGLNAQQFNGTTIYNNHIVLAEDGAGDVYLQTLGINYSFGLNQTIEDNIIDMPGNGSGTYGEVAMQSNTDGGDAYNGLLIEGNTINVLNYSSTDSVIGIWENGWDGSSNITVSNNSWNNLDPTNDPAMNQQIAFWMTSDSSNSATVTYENNNVSGANIGFQYAGSQHSSAAPVQILGNTLTNVYTGFDLRTYPFGLTGTTATHFSGNTITGTGSGGIGIDVGQASSITVDAVDGTNSISGFATGIEVSGADASAIISGNTGSIYGNNIGIDVDGGSATISNNHIYDNATGIEFTSGGSGSVSGNNFAGSTDNGTDLLIDSAGVSIGDSNAFAGSSYYIENQSITAYDLSSDASTTFGGFNAATTTVTPGNLATFFGIEDEIVDYLDNPSYGYVRITSGYDFVADTSEAATPGAIQRAVNVANTDESSVPTDGDIVEVQAGAFVANVDVPTSQTIIGAGEGLTTVYPALDNPMGGSLGSAVIKIDANNVTIQDLTVDGDSGPLSDDIYASTGIITDWNQDDSFSGMTVENVTVQNIYERGIEYAVGNNFDVGTFDWENDTVTNVNGDPGSSVAMFNYGGSGVIANNNVSYTPDAINTNWSRGTDIYSNTVTNAGSGVHSDNNGGADGVADSIHDNNLSLGTAGAYGIFVFVPYLDVSVQDNTISGVDVGLAAFGSGSSDGSASFSDNTVSVIDGGTGAYVTTDTLGYGQFNVSASFSGGSFTGGATGIAVQNLGATATATITGVAIHDPTTGIEVGSGASVALSNNNFDGGSSADDNTVDLLIDSGAASVTTAGDTFAANEYYIDNQSTLNIDATADSFHNVSATDTNFRIEDKMYHKVDDLSLGLVTWVADTVFVTSPQINNAYDNSASTDSSIQRGIDAASDGDTVNVEAGEYAQTVTVDKSIQLLGAEYGVTPVTGGRVGGESLLDYPGGEVGIEIDANDVVVSGFEIADQAFSIATEDFNNVGDGVFHDVQISYNYIHSDVAANAGIVLGLNQNDGTSTFTNFTVSHNLVNVSGANAEAAVAPAATAVYDGLNISYNDLSDPDGRAIFAGGDPAFTQFNEAVISWNDIHDTGHSGINMANLIDATVSHNTFTNTAGDGAYLNMSGGSFTYNTISSMDGDYEVGLELWGNDYGTALVTHGVEIANNSFTYNDTPAQYTVGVMLDSDGVDATSLNVHDNTFTDDSGVSTYAIGNQSGSTLDISTGSNIFNGVTLDGSTTLPQLYTIADAVLDKVDVASFGYVVLRTGNVYVTPNSIDDIYGTTTTPSVQRGIDAASAGDTVNVEAGTYVGGVRVNKSVKLLGSGLPTVGTGDFGDGYGGALEVGANDVTINGFNILGDGSGNVPSDNYGVLLLHATNDTTIEFSTIGGFNNGILTEDDGNAPDGQTGTLIENNQFNATAAGDFAIYIQGTGGHNQTITNNQFASDEGGILLQNVYDDFVTGNTFTSSQHVVVVVDSDDITINENLDVGSTGNAVALYGGATNVTITQNTIYGGVAAAIAVENIYSATNAPNGGTISITQNFLGSTSDADNNPSGHSSSNDNACGVYVAADPSPGSIYTLAGNAVVDINDNSIYHNTTAGLENDSSVTINADYNWWGDPSGPTNAANPGGTGDAIIDPSVTFSPWLTDGTDSQPAVAGFQPNATAAVSISGPSTGTEGATYMLNLSPSSDITSWAINWQDGPGNSDDIQNVSGRTTSVTHVFAEFGSYSISAVADSTSGDLPSNTLVVAVADAPLTATGTNVSATEGAALTDVQVGTLNDEAGSYSNPSDLSATINWGDSNSSPATLVEIGSTGVYTVEGSHTYAEYGSYPIGVSYSDVGGSTTTSSSTATVADAPLSPGTITAAGGVEGVSPTSLSATFTDANLDASTADFSGTINWGDGNTINFTFSAVSGSGGSYTVSGSHQYTEEGNYNITVVINDDGGSTTTDTGSTTVADAPLVDGQAFNVGAVGGVAFTNWPVASFQDSGGPESTSDYAATITWGDSGFSAGTIVYDSGNTFSVLGSYSYASTGSFPITVAITHETAPTLNVSGGYGNVIASFSTVYVDDNWVDASNPGNPQFGDIVTTPAGETGPATTLVFGVNAFDGQQDTYGMQAAFNAVPANGTVNVLPGTYAGNATTNQPFTLTVTAGTATINGSLNGNFTLTKQGNGTLVLGGDNGYTGGTLVGHGHLQVSADDNLGDAAGNVTLTTPGILEITGNMSSSRTFELSNSTLLVDNGDTLTLTGGEVDDGFLTGPGTIQTSGATATLFAGNQATTSVTINGNGPADFLNFTNGGALNLISGDFDLTSFTNGSNGRLSVSSLADVSDFLTYGPVTVNAGGEIDNVGDSGLTFGNGSVTTVIGPSANGMSEIDFDDPDFSTFGFIDLGNTDGVLSAALMINDGIVLSSMDENTVFLDVGYGSLLKGYGLTQFQLEPGGVYLPGHSPGTGYTSAFNVNPGGTLQIQYSDATGTAGNLDGWSEVVVEPNFFSGGEASLNFTATPSAPFNIQLATVIDTPPYNTPGAMANFDLNQSYSWQILDATNPADTVTGTFSPADFNIITTDFANATDGAFSVQFLHPDGSPDNNDTQGSLFVVYTPDGSLTEANTNVSSPENVPATNSGTFSDADQAVTLHASAGNLVVNYADSSDMSGTWSWSGTGDDNSPYNVTISMTNNAGGAEADPVNFGVSFTDVPPTVAADNATVTTLENATTSNTGTFADYDDAVTISELSGPAGTISQTSGISGTWSWTQNNPMDEGSYPVVIEATNADGSTATTTFTLNVTDVAPTVAADNGTVTTLENATTSNTGTFADYDDAVTISELSGPAGSISQTSGISGTWSWTQNNPMDEGSYPVVIEATNADGSTATTTFTLNVTDVAPTVAADNGTVTTLENATTSNTGTFADYDDAVTISELSGPAGTISQTSGISGTWSWTQNNPMDEGSYPVVIEATNADGSTATTTFTLNVTDVAPTVAADNGTVTTLENATTSNTGTFADYDDAVTISELSGPAGTISQTSGINGTWSWTQNNPVDEGSYPVVIEATNADGSTATTTFTLNVTDVAPTVAADNGTVTTLENATTSNTGTFADYDDAVTISELSGPAGTISQTSGISGTWSWTQNNPMDEGSYPVVIEATNADGSTATTTFTLNVTDVAPTVAADNGTVTTLENATTSNTGTFADYDDAVTISELSGPAGTISQTSGINGTWSWTQNNPVDEGSYAVVIEATNADGSTATTTFTLNVTDVAPTVAADNGTVTTPENATTSNTGTFADYDDAVTISELSGPAGTISQTSGISGTWSWTQNNPMDEGSYAVVIEATNADGSTATTTFTLNVTDVAPTVAADNGTVTTLENATTSNTGTFADYDDAVTISELSGPAGTISQTSGISGTWSWTQNNPMDEGSYPVVIEATNADGSTATTTFTLNVTDVAPTVAADNGTVTTLENATTSNTGTFADYDDTVTISELSGPAGTISQTSGISGTWSWTQNNPMDEGSYPVVIEATNADGSTATTTFTLNVTDVAPTVAADNGTVTTLENATTSNTGTFADYDDAVTISELSGPAGTISQTSGINGTWSWTQNNPVDEGSYPVVIEATNADGSTATTTFTLNVTDVAPTVAADNGTVTTLENATTSNTGTFADYDDAVTISELSGPAGTISQTSGINGTWSWTQNNPVDEGSYPVVIEATNADGSTATTTFTLNVTDVAPTVAADNGTVTTLENATTSNTGTFADYDDAVTISELSGPAGTISQTSGISGTWSWTQNNPMDEGSYPVVIEATNADGSTATTTFTLNVTDVAPTVAADNGTVTTLENATTSNTGTFADYDDAVTISELSGPAGTISQTSGINGTWSWTQNNPMDEGSYPVVIEATNADGSTATTTFTLNVTDVAPTVAADNGTVTTLENATTSNTGTFADYDDAVTISELSGPAGTISQTSGINGTWSWTQNNPMDEGSYAVVIEATNADGSTATTTFTLNVTDVAPTVAADNGTVTTPENATTSNTGTFADYDDAVTISELSGPAGTISQTSGISGTWSWTQNNPVDEGSYAVVIEATNADGSTATTTFTLNVTDVAPTVAADNGTVTTLENATTSNTGTFADYDDAVTISELSGPAGTISQTSGISGTWSWTQNNPVDEGSYPVVIEATNADGSTATTTFTLNVTDVPPTVAADNATVTTLENATTSNTGTFADYDDAVTISELSGPAGTISQTSGINGTWSWTQNNPVDEGSYAVVIEATNADGSTATTTFTLNVTDVPPTVAADNATVTTPENATTSNTGTFADYDDAVTISELSGPAGSISQTSGISGTWSWTQNNPVDEGSYPVVIEATNADGSTATTTFTLNVTDVAPTVAADNATVTTLENATTSNTGTFADYDDAVTISELSGPAGSISQTSGINGMWSWTQNNPVDEGSYAVVIEATNADGSTATTTFTLNVTDVPPTVAADNATVTTLENATTSNTGTFADYDDAVTISELSGPAGSISQTSGISGTWSWTQNNPVDEGSYPVVIEATNADGSTATTTFTLNVTDVAPTVAADNGTVTTLENATTSNTGTFADYDDAVTISELSGPAGTISQTSGINGTWSWTQNNPVDEGSYAVVIEATNADGSTATTTFTLNVTDVPPTVAADNATVTTPENATTSNTGTFADYDDAVTISELSGPAGSISQTSGISGTWTWTQNNPVDEGSYAVVIEATNADGSTATTTFTLNVTDVAPTVAADNATVTTLENATTSNTGTFADYDDAVTISELSGPAGSISQTSGINGMWSWTQNNPVDEGSYAVVIEATNADGSTATTTFTLNVTDVAPTVAADNATVTTLENATTSNTGTFADYDDAVTISELSGPAGTISQTSGISGTWTWTQNNPVDEGSYPVVIEATNADGSTATTTFTLNVTDAPLTAGTVTAAGGVEYTTATTLSATFTDANLNAPTSDFSGTINWGDGNTTNFDSSAVTGSGGSYIVAGSHQYAEDGVYDITVTINDDGGSTTTDTGMTTVADAPLTAGTVTAAGGVEYTTAASLSATFTDANLDAPTSDFSGTINWGDGNTTDFDSSAVSGTGGSYTVSGSHQYAVGGTYNITVTINDDGGASTIDSGFTTVSSFTNTTVTSDPVGPITLGTSVTFTANITNANPGDAGSVSFYYDYGQGGQFQIGGPVNVMGGSATSDATTALPAGSDVITAIYSGGPGLVGSMGTLTIQVNGPPTITNVVLNEDISALYNAAGQPAAGVQRSMVNDIVYTFSEPVNIVSSGIESNVFTIAVAAGWSGTLPTLNWMAVSGTNDMEWAVTFSGNGVTGGSIANGAYTITVNDPTAITAASDNQALSLAGSGIGGATQSFYRLFGDINGDEFVNAVDNFSFKQALTTYNAAFDFNADGFVNASDNLKFKQDLTVNFSGFTPTI